MDASVITAFQELSGLGRSVVISLFQQLSQGGIPDFHVAITRALSLKMITEKNARIASMVHLTGIKRDRAAELLALSDEAAPYDLNNAIVQARNYADISAEVASTAQMRALTNLPQARAQFFLRQTKPKGFVEEAISRAKIAGAITPRVAAIGILKILTGFSDSVAVNMLGPHHSVERAIEQGQNRFQDPLQYALARLRARFRLTSEDARRCLLRQDVRGDFDKACHQVKIDQVMDKVIVDHEDALSYLQQCNCNVESAIKLAQDHQLLQPSWAGLNADTRNPPDVHANTHIIGVLGVCDLGHQRRASPHRDGWMVSDFYLWISVLEGMGKSQSWFSCENPYGLLSKYGSEAKELEYTSDEGTLERAPISWAQGYIHGDPFEERVLVLSEKNVAAMAKKVTRSNHGTDLRDDFLRCVEKTCQIAEAANEPVLLMGFCHGDEGDTELGGLCIGIDDGSQNEGDFLSTKLLAQSLAKTPKVRVSLYLTSCFSGNWVITPQLKLSKPTVMATAQPDEESYAWEASASMRHAGGVYTSAFLRELQKEPTELPEDADPREAHEYNQVCQAIIHEANRLWVQIGGSTPMFTPDGGHDKFWRRTGFSLADYKKNYDRLERILASDPNPYKDKKRHVGDISDTEYRAWQLRHPEDADENFSSRTGSYGRTRRGMIASVTYLAERYMASHPGPRNAPSNTALQADIELFRAGGFAKDYDAIERLRSQLLYRTWMMRQANSYREWMNLNKIPAIEAWDQDRPGKAIGLAKQNLAMVRGSGLFSRPDTRQGYWGQVWQKPAYYLAYAFAASGYGPSDIPKLIQMLKETHRKLTIHKIRRFVQLPDAQKSIRHMSDIMGRTWGKSAHKRKCTSLEEAGLRS
ncbi:MAG: hypothetical protein Q9181_005917 [Wetmoreana brouardii]